MKKHIELIGLMALLVLLVASNSLLAWTAPTQSPPNGNVAAPVNVGSSQQIKAGGLGVGALDVAGGSIFRGRPTIESAAPTILFNDTDATYLGNHRNFWFHVNGGRMHLLGDRNDDGSWDWDTEGPWPMEANLGATSNEDWIKFSNQVRARQYCDENGANCADIADLAGASTGSGIGYDQDWMVVNRTQGVWYRNGTGKPIMVFHKNIYDGTIIDIGAATTTAVRMNYQDYDSDLDNGSTIIVPPGHYYRFGTPTENSSNGHRVVRELR